MTHWDINHIKASEKVVDDLRNAQESLFFYVRYFHIDNLDERSRSSVILQAT